MANATPFWVIVTLLPLSLNIVFPVLCKLLEGLRNVEDHFLVLFVDHEMRSESRGLITLDGVFVIFAWVFWK